MKSIFEEIQISSTNLYRSQKFIVLYDNQSSESKTDKMIEEIIKVQFQNQLSSEE